MSPVQKPWVVRLIHTFTLALERTFYYTTHMDRKEKVVRFYERHRRMPSYGEMMALLGYKSKAAVHYFVNKLIEAGVVEKDAQGRLIPGAMLGGTKLLGLVEAGF